MIDEIYHPGNQQAARLDNSYLFYIVYGMVLIGWVWEWYKAKRKK